MKKLMTIALGLICAVGAAVAGNIDSPGAPSAGSGMYTLQNLYDYLINGTALSVVGSFQEPTSGPASTMKSTKQIGDDVKALFDQCDALPEDVQVGKKFFCTQPGNWGVKEGTYGLPTPTPTATEPEPTPTPTITPTSGGNWYDIYGPSGQNKVLKYTGQYGEDVYIALHDNNEGTNFDATMTWADAWSYAGNLNWLEKDDWTLFVFGQSGTCAAIWSSLDSVNTTVWTSMGCSQACGGGRMPQNLQTDGVCYPTDTCNTCIDDTSLVHIRVVRSEGGEG